MSAILVLLRSRRLEALLACAALAAAGLAAAVQTAVAGATGGMQRIGAAPVLPRGTVGAGTVAPARMMRVTLALLPRDPAAMAAYARAVSTPGSPAYRHYLTPSQFARRFGASPSQLAALRVALRARGLQPGAVSANGLSIRVSADAGELQRAFSVRLARVRLPSGARAVANTSAPALPGDVAGLVQAVIGLSSLQTQRPLRQAGAPSSADALPGARGESGRLLRPGVLRASRPGPRALSAHADTGGPQPCSAAIASASSQGGYTVDQIASAYGFSGLYRAGDEGQGVTVALFELEPYDSRDIAAYAACYGIHPQVENVSVDGGAGSGTGSGEAALDIEQVIGLAPRARVLVYEGPNSNANGPGSGPYDVLSAIVSQDAAQVISTSWGQCEALEGASDARAESVLLQEAAIQGQSVLAAAGDAGSEDCDGETATPDTSLAVDDPGSQPWVTSVGGTTLSSPGPPPRETVWNNGGNVGGLLGLAPGAGGGGLSSLWSMPAYQTTAAPALHVIDAYSSGRPCAAGGYCRQVPDVSADADPNTGYLIYYNGSGTAGPDVPSGWQVAGGTSGAAPLWAALVALADADGGCAHGPVGFLNPALYRAAGADYARTFHDITAGNNDFTATNGGRYPAAVGYDMASGLGTPDAAALAGALCSSALVLRSPGAQLATVGAAVHVRLHATDARDQAVLYRALSLPPGLAVNAERGVIFGSPRRTGFYIARVLAYDRGGDARRVSFAFRILSAPRIGGLSLSGVNRGRPSLTLSIQVARGAPALRQLTLHLPAGLRLAGARGLAVRGLRGRRLGYHARAAGARLAIWLAQPSTRVALRLSWPGLVASSVLRARERAHRVGALALALSCTDTRGETTAFSRSVGARS